MSAKIMSLIPDVLQSLQNTKMSLLIIKYKFVLDAGELIPGENLDVTKYKGTVPVYPQPLPSPFDPPGLDLLTDGKVNLTEDIILDLEFIH